jgi:transposase
VGHQLLRTHRALTRQFPESELLPVSWTPGLKRRSFTREFKVEAVKLMRERGVSVAQAARDLDAHDVGQYRHTCDYGSLSGTALDQIFRSGSLRHARHGVLTISAIFS